MTVLPAGRLPDLLNDDELLVENGFTVPEAAPAEVPAAMKGTTEGARAKADSLHTLDPQDAPARFGPTTPTRASSLDLPPGTGPAAVGESHSRWRSAGRAGSGL